MKALKCSIYAVAIIASLIALYFFAALIGAAVPASGQPSERKDVEIFLRRSGIHTDIIAPMDTNVVAWSEIVNSEHTLSDRTDFRYVAFGWGDLNFFQEVPTWDDITIKASVRALFLKTPSAIRIVLHSHMTEDQDTVSIMASREQYQMLADFIKDSFEYDDKGSPQQVEGLRYSKTDAFYRAKRSVNLFYTCNTWTNSALKRAQLPACLWTPFPHGIFYQYRH